MNTRTCVSMNCPFIRYCKMYNFETDRGIFCEYQEDILMRADKMLKERRKEKRSNEKSIRKSGR